MKQFILQFSIFLSFLCSFVHSEAVQFCQVDVKRKSDLCIAVSSAPNGTTDAFDLYLSFSVLFEKREGWAAFGIGEAMNGALMFVMYPGGKLGDVTFSVRSTIGHLPPTAITDQDMVRVVDVRTEGDYHVIDAICFSCNQWKSSELNVMSTEQPWLFSTHYHQRTRTDDPKFPLVLHTDYGKLTLDMARSLSENEDMVHPVVTQDRISTPGSSSPHDHSDHRRTLSAAQAHGALLGFSTLLIFAGLIGIRSGHKRSFQIHWLIQTIASVGVITGCIVGLIMSKSPIQLFTFGSTHKIIGIVIFTIVPLQMFFGYRHHINFIKVGGRTKVSHWHIWLGRIMFIGLNGNVAMGLQLAQASLKDRVVWGIIVSLEVLTLASLWFYKRRERKQRNNWADYSKIHDDQSEAFIIGDDNNRDVELD